MIFWMLKTWFFEWRVVVKSWELPGNTKQQPKRPWMCSCGLLQMTRTVHKFQTTSLPLNVILTPFLKHFEWSDARCSVVDYITDTSKLAPRSSALDGKKVALCKESWQCLTSCILPRRRHVHWHQQNMGRVLVTCSQWQANDGQTLSFGTSLIVNPLH